MNLRVEITLSVLLQFKNFTRYLKIYTQTPVITDWQLQDNLVVLSNHCFFSLTKIAQY